MPLILEGVTVSGSQRLRLTLSGDANRRSIKSAFMAEYQREVLPELSARTPRVSGRTSRRYGVERTGEGFALRSTAYAPHIRFARRNRPRALFARTVVGLEQRIVKPKLGRIARRAVRKALGVSV